MPKSNAEIGASEDHRTEWKETWRDEYLKTLCAFANGEGGLLEVGRNDKGEAVGVSDAKKLLEDLPNKARDVLGIMIEVRLVREGRRALVALTAPSYPHPVSYRGRYYVRSGSTTQELRGAALDRFLLQKQGRTWDGVPLPELKESDLSQAALERFRKLAGASGRLPKADLQAKLPALIDKLKLRDGVYLKRAAALLFHEDPERFVTGAFVKIGFFRSESDLVYHDEIHGDLFAQVERSIDLIVTKYFKAAITYDGIQRVEAYPVPEAALREALLNAVVHRDYAIPAPIQIRIYPDHMKLWNPAMLPDGWDLKRLLGEHASHPFNPDLANTFFRAGEIETWGRGIHRIFAACKAAAAPKPEVRYEPNDLWFEFPFSDRYLAAIEGASEPTGRIRKRQGTTQETIQETTQEKIVALMQERPEITRKALAARLELSESGVKYHLDRLRKAGLIRHVGATKSGHWEILK